MTTQIQAAQRLQAADAQEELEVEVSIKGPKGLVERLLGALYLAKFSGDVGHSGTFAFEFDGDGADLLDIVLPPEYRTTFSDLAKELCKYGAPVEGVVSPTKGFILTNNSAGAYLKRTPISSDGTNV